MKRQWQFPFWIVTRLIAIAAVSVVALVETTLAEAQGCRLTRKIVGGHTAKIEDWPGIAAIRLHHFDDKVSLQLCGGAAITPDWVVTAAHCFDDLEGIWRRLVSKTDDFSRVRVEVLLGVDNLDNVTEADVYPVKSWHRHDVYSQAFQDALAGPNPKLAALTAQKHGHDIALVKLARPWTGPLSELSLSKETDPEVLQPGKQNVIVTGFGSIDPRARDLRPFTRSNGERYFGSTPELLEVVLPLVDTNSCKSYWISSRIGDGQLCAGFEQGRGKDSCNGDSGGPIVALDARLCPRQIGLVSWGAAPCAPQNKAYGVYTRISAFADWLLRHVPDLE